MQHITRLYLRGTAYLGFAILISYSLIVFLFPQNMVQTPRYHSSMAGGDLTRVELVQQVNAYMDTSFYTSRPWPASFAAWLFNTRGRIELRADNRRTREQIVPGTEGEPHGVLVGDLGYSWYIYRNEPVVKILGQEPWLLPLLALAGTLALSSLALLKMRRRGLAYSVDDTHYIEPYGEHYAARQALAQMLRTPY